jgi:hypothetical protein
MAALNFARMNKPLIIILCLAAFGCVNHPTSSVVSRRDEMIQIAKREIDRRHIQLPRDCDITVVEGMAVSPVDKAREEYFVQFTFTHGGKRDIVYKVVIDKRSRKVSDFLDYRHTVPGGG